MKVVFTIAFAILLTLSSCTGFRKYYKAAEQLEKQGLVDDAAAYYLEALKRKPTNVSARIKVKEVGQKHVSALSSDFFRRYNTQDLEGALETFEKLKRFHESSAALNIYLDYPKTYEEDYSKTVEQFCQKNYNTAMLFLSQKKYGDALIYIGRVKKYNASYRNLQQIDVIATCEPLYQNAITALESKNYPSALNYLSGIKSKTESYKDYTDLLELASAQQSRSFILFVPKSKGNRLEKEIEDALYNSFSQIALQKMSVRIINNTPFQNSPSATDLNNSTNIDLVQAIRKATGADYFYVYDVSNFTQYNPGVSKVQAKAYQQVSSKQGTVVVTEYKPVEYNVVKGQRAFSYDFKYRIINAYNNQIVASQTQNIRSQDAIEYNEFRYTFNGNVNSLFPYNPAQTAPVAQYNPRNWRALFSARNNLKSFEDLRNDAYSQNVNLFTNSATSMK